MTRLKSDIAQLRAEYDNVDKARPSDVDIDSHLVQREGAQLWLAVKTEPHLFKTQVLATVEKKVSRVLAHLLSKHDAPVGASNAEGFRPEVEDCTAADADAGAKFLHLYDTQHTTCNLPSRRLKLHRCGYGSGAN